MAILAGLTRTDGWRRFAPRIKNRVLIYIHIMHIYIERRVKDERVLVDSKPASSKNKTERLHKKKGQEYESSLERILLL